MTVARRLFAEMDRDGSGCRLAEYVRGSLKGHLPGSRASTGLIRAWTLTDLELTERSLKSAAEPGV